MPADPLTPDLRAAAEAAALARSWLQRRDDAIRAALVAGASLRAVASAVGMAHNAIVRIRDRG